MLKIGLVLFCLLASDKQTINEILGWCGICNDVSDCGACCSPSFLFLLSILNVDRKKIRFFVEAK